MGKPLTGIITFILISVSFFGVYAPKALAADIVVDTDGDLISDDGFCTLREAITSANNDDSPGTIAGECEDGSGPDEISFDGVSGTIMLGGVLPMVTQSLNIFGPGAGELELQGNGQSRVFNFISPTQDQSFSLSNLKITGGFSNGSAGGIFLGDGQTLDIFGCEISGNSATGGGGSGGGIGTGNDSSLSIFNSTIAGNNADSSGGGVSVGFHSTLTLHQSTVHNNNSGSAGGGGISCASCTTLNITNTTVSENFTDGSGGGIGYLGDVNGTANLSNVTLVNNTADQDMDASGLGGGIANIFGTFNFKNTILAGNTDNGNGNPDCYGIFTSLDFNLIQDATGCTINGDTGNNITNEDPLLGPLADNGGPTQTHALLTDSPAIDTGDDAGCTDENGSPLTEDQRGYPRSVDGDENLSPRCDMGAFEVGICSDGYLDSLTGEECDDGNDSDGDGCSSLCQTEEVLPEENSKEVQEEGSLGTDDGNFTGQFPSSQPSGCSFQPSENFSNGFLDLYWFIPIFFLGRLSKRKQA